MEQAISVDSQTTLGKSKDINKYNKNNNIDRVSNKVGSSNSNSNWINDTNGVSNKLFYFVEISHDYYSKQTYKENKNAFSKQNTINNINMSMYSSLRVNIFIGSFETERK